MDRPTLRVISRVLDSVSEQLEENSYKDTDKELQSAVKHLRECRKALVEYSYQQQDKA